MPPSVLFFNPWRFLIDIFPGIGTGGDTAKSFAKIGKYVYKYADDAPKVAEAISKSAKYGSEVGEFVTDLSKHLPSGTLDKISDSIKNGKKITKADYDILMVVFKKSDKQLNAKPFIQSKPSSKVLDANMKKANKKVPKYKHAAHHIVAGTAPKAQPARAIFLKYRIDINDEANGIYLPTDKTVTERTYHPSLHTNDYYEAVNQLIVAAQSREDVFDILEYIYDELENDTFNK